MPLNSMRDLPAIPTGREIPRLPTIIFAMVLMTALTGCATGPVRPDPDDRDFVELVEKKWDTVELSTTTAWVDYDPELETRSKINFVGGIVEVETVLPEEGADIPEAGRKNIESQTRKIFSLKIQEDYNVLADQVETESGEVVTEQNLSRYIENEVIPAIEKAPSAYVAEDGVKRIKLKTRLKLVSGHQDVRAMHYFPMVKEKADKYGLSAPVIMAMIHAESHFNPYAQSSDGALGLMQLMPQYGGREAHQYLFGKDRTPSKKDLFDPENNISLGTAYYHLLKTRHFSSEKQDDKKRLLALSAYNLGPTRVKKIAEREARAGMTQDEFYAMLIRQVPKETRDYLKKIVRLTEKYKAMERAFARKRTMAAKTTPPPDTVSTAAERL